MDFKNFSNFSFYDLLARISQIDWADLSSALQAYERELSLAEEDIAGLGSCIELLEEKRIDPTFKVCKGIGTAQFKESLFRLSRALGCADIDWQNAEEVERLWHDERIWQKENLLKLKVSSRRHNNKNLTIRRIVERLQTVLEKEYEQRAQKVFQFFLDLWDKGFLSPGETKKMEQLQESIKVLSRHEHIIDSHKLQGLETLREQMGDFQSTLPINSRQVTAFLTLAKTIRESLDFFKQINANLALITVSYTNLIAILGEEKTPLTVYKDWFHVIAQNRRKLQKVALLSDEIFLRELLTSLHKQGWREELINLVPPQREVHRFCLTYPAQWPDVVDAYYSFGEFVKEWQKEINKVH